MSYWLTKTMVPGLDTGYWDKWGSNSAESIFYAEVNEPGIMAVETGML